MPITLFMGPMYSGKTLSLISRMERHQLLKHSCIVIGYKHDNRYTTEQKIVSHNNASWPCLKLDATELEEMVPKFLETYDVIGIDEGCFFGNIVEICTTLSNAGKTVYVSSLVGDYRRRPFGNICNLIPICTKIEQSFAICSGCEQENASFTHLIRDELKSIKIGSKELIGSTDKYISLCEPCFLKAYNKPKPASGTKNKSAAVTKEIKSKTSCKSESGSKATTDKNITSTAAAIH